MRWPKYWSFSCYSIMPSKEIPGLISFRMDWLNLLAVQGTLKSLLQHHSSKASILRCSATTQYNVCWEINVFSFSWAEIVCCAILDVTRQGCWVVRSVGSQCADNFNTMPLKWPGWWPLLFMVSFHDEPSRADLWLGFYRQLLWSGSSPTGTRQEPSWAKWCCLVHHPQHRSSIGISPLRILFTVRSLFIRLLSIIHPFLSL